MNRILVVGEDALTCALGERLISDVLPQWKAAAPTINAGGVTNLHAALGRYKKFAQNVAPVLCLVDSDGKCPAELLLRWLPLGRPANMLVRFAVHEAESWVLGDRRAAADFFQVPMRLIPPEPDQLVDPKAEMLRIARRSGSRQLREEMVSSVDEQRKGAGYNAHLRRFVQTKWSSRNALERSPSLKRAVESLKAL